MVEIAGRQRTLAERYVRETMLVKAGEQADPATTASLLHDSAETLIDGGVAPAVNGDDDETALPTATGLERRQLIQGRRLVNDLTATGSAWLANRPVDAVELTANEKVTATDPGAATRSARRTDIERLAQCRTDDCDRAPTRASRP